MDKYYHDIPLWSKPRVGVSAVWNLYNQCGFWITAVRLSMTQQGHLKW
jgi:hypothetical protein